MPSHRLVRAAALCATAGLFWSCAGEVAVDPASTHFTIRGRWPRAPALTWRAEERGAPIDAAAWRREVLRACDAWSATGHVSLTEAGADADADVTLGWRRGHHGACEPFGIAATVAHSGPVRPGTFIHFDADRQWHTGDAETAESHSAYAAALHELGHVLGLGHSAASTSVMQTDAVDVRPLSASEAFGLQSLYGGGQDAPGDLAVLAADGSRLCTLRGVAPRDRSGFACFDVDGDAACEVVVWRDDVDGRGALMCYHFDAGGVTRTTGPFFGMAASADGARNGVAVFADHRLFFTVFQNGRVAARRFDKHGLLAPHDAGAWQPPTTQPRRGDVDGDGVIETVARVGA